jgi:glycosyltransferase involved in cell wall biosynthesis
MAVTDTPPVVSALMPVYNNEPHLGPAIESILAQTFGDFEFIIINDGSTDDSSTTLNRFLKQDSRIRLYERPNTGYCRALNEGLGYVRGEFIARMDADDIAMPDRFERQVAYLREHPECVALGGRVLLIDDDDAPIREMCHEETHEAIDAAHMEGKGGTIIHPAMMARRSAIEAINGYDESFAFAEDLDFFLRLAEYGRVANLPAIVLHYRQHLTSIGYSKSEIQQRSAVDAVRAAHKRRGLPLPPELESVEPRKTTLADVHRKWVWWALGDGNIASARKHARVALFQDPLNIESWRAAVCALRGH